MKYLAAAALVALMPGLAHGNPADARGIVAQVEERLAPRSVTASYRFVNTRSDGTTTTYEVRFSVKDPDHSRGEFLQPERERGREVLRLGDDLWTFVPSIGRVVRVADRDSFAGGDFSNADVLRVDWLSQYEPKILKDLPSQWIIELSAKGSGAAYAKMRLWVDKASGQPVQQTFHDSRGTQIKRCRYGDVQTLGPVVRPARLEMENVITGQKSALTVLSVAAAADIPASRFTVDNLGK